MKLCHWYSLSIWSPIVRLQRKTIANLKWASGELEKQ